MQKIKKKKERREGGMNENKSVRLWLNLENNKTNSPTVTLAIQPNKDVPESKLRSYN